MKLTFNHGNETKHNSEYDMYSKFEIKHEQREGTSCDVVFDVVRMSQQAQQSYVTVKLCAFAIVCYCLCLLKANVC